jgi:hypothetical protein
MISQKEEMRTGTQSSGVVLHDMIEGFIFTLSFSHKKEMRSEKHTADVVLPGSPCLSCYFSAAPSWCTAVMPLAPLLSFADVSPA